ncbi:MAG: AmmeMemoRadiSam system radical SAM enzyme [bacterium]|nr:AmmeMemoRadiSam system radical SAM enzyme [bacterium]MDT8395250.1 AmmeMemoRadiSam system radical SAM enzyme [bacterium]
MLGLIPPRSVECTLCPKLCRLAEGQRGDCRVRYNDGGNLYSLVYGKVCSVHVDPVEKKPMYHFLPGSGAFSVATAGCNLHCLFCQNWEISQADPEDLNNSDLPPEKAVTLAAKAGCASIAYTYSEPVIFYEYLEDTAALARERGIRNIMVTAGFINRDPLRRLCKIVDGANVDLKGFTEKYYREVCFGNLRTVLDTLVTMRKEGVVLEVTNLIVPTLNDGMNTISQMCRWIVSELGDEVPLHFSRFSPMYRLKDLPPTPVQTLRRARETALEAGLKYVYTGNVPGDPGEDTFCPSCGKMVIDRHGYRILKYDVVDGKCKYCGQKIYGLF